MTIETRIIHEADAFEPVILELRITSRRDAEALRLAIAHGRGSNDAIQDSLVRLHEAVVEVLK